PEKSVGGAFLDFTDDERGGFSSKDSIKQLITKKVMSDSTIETLYKRSMYGWTMWVDAFGNILVDTGARQYVVVPAAMNPYVFKKSGVVLDKDPGAGQPFEYGRAVPVNNLISIALASQNKLLKTDGELTDDTATFNVGNIHGNFPNGDKGRKGFYKFAGSNDLNWSESSAG